MEVTREGIIRGFEYCEEIGMPEEEILEMTAQLVLHCNSDIDLMHELNEIVYHRGYSFEFEIERTKRQLDLDAFAELSTQTVKSKAKTESLIDHIRYMGDHRLTFATWHMLKLKHLIDLYYVEDNPLLTNKNLTLRDLFVQNYHNEEIKTIVRDALSELGMPYAWKEYNDFRLDLEYLLWTIEKKEPNYGYKKINTIKVALEMAPNIYFERGDIKYYYSDKLKEAKKFIKLIDKDAISFVKAKWGEKGVEELYDGYQLFYKYL